MKKLNITISIIIIFYLFGCTRYEDGPRISLRNPYNKISGVWKVNTFDINGIDSISLYNNITNFSKIEIRLRNEEPEVNIINLFDISNKNYLGGTINFMNFNNSKYDSLYISFFESDSLIYNNFIDPLKSNIISYWKIKRLSNDELWISSLYNNKVYNLELVKVEKIITW